MEPPPNKRLRTSQRICPHCREIVSYKTYRAHKRLYCNDDGTWIPVGGKSTSVLTSEEEHEESPPLSPITLPEDFSVTDDYHESPPCSDTASSSSYDSGTESDPGSEVWSDNDELDDEDMDRPESPPSCQEKVPADNSTNIQPLVRWLLAFFLLLQARFHLTDRVLNLVFRFLKTFFLVLGKVSAPCAAIGAKLPHTFYMAQKSYTLLHKGQGFRKYPVCKRCGTVWPYDECFEGHGLYKKAKLCSHVAKFSRGRRRQQCNGILFKTVELATNRKIFYPLMTYCYVDLQTALERLLLDADFAEKCNQWHSRASSDGCLKDVYDGRVWKSFLEYNGRPFLSQKHNYAFMINIDWFQPYKHLTYSVGAIYLSVFNLPRTDRYKLKNICLVGIIPGPSEPKLTVNNYLDPLVQDLLGFWTGKELLLNNGSHTERRLVRCAIICCSCDLPAGRKLCGFLGHSAHLGCSKCMKLFPTLGDSLDYSGFQRENWISRTNHSHRQNVHKLSQCKSKTELLRKETELGCRYSALLKLPYFDPPKMLVIDPMHNLFLGVAKHFFKRIFLDKGTLSEASLKTVQQRIDSMCVPSDIGRIPHKIESSFYHFTADQYKNWVIHYSIICLHNLLSPEHMDCWRHFVLACRLLCNPTLKPNDITLADAFLLHFCRRTERMFGREVITPNMHMSCHLRECILDFGPINHFWLFAFERFNGILGQLPTNNRSVEVQMMKRFLYDTEVMRISIPREFRDDFKSLLSFDRGPVGTLGTDVCTPSTPENGISLPHSFTRSVLDSSAVNQLSLILGSALHSSLDSVGSLYKRYTHAIIKGKLFGCFKSRAKNSSIILADLNGEVRPARINFFAQVSAVTRNGSRSFVLVHLSWFRRHPQKNACGKPVTIWEHDDFEVSGFSEIQHIQSRTVSLVDKLDDIHGTVLFVSPYEF